MMLDCPTPNTWIREIVWHYSQTAANWVSGGGSALQTGLDMYNIDAGVLKSFSGSASLAGRILTMDDMFPL